MLLCPLVRRGSRRGARLPQASRNAARGQRNAACGGSKWPLGGVAALARCARHRASHRAYPGGHFVPSNESLSTTFDISLIRPEGTDTKSPISHHTGDFAAPWPWHPAGANPLCERGLCRLTRYRRVNASPPEASLAGNASVRSHAASLPGQAVPWNDDRQGRGGRAGTGARQGATRPWSAPHRPLAH